MAAAQIAEAIGRSSSRQSIIAMLVSPTAFRASVAAVMRAISGANHPRVQASRRSACLQRERIVSRRHKNQAIVAARRTPRCPARPATLQPRPMRAEADECIAVQRDLWFLGDDPHPPIPVAARPEPTE